jgi:hypothetical protein
MGRAWVLPGAGLAGLWVLASGAVLLPAERSAQAPRDGEAARSPSGSAAAGVEPVVHDVVS